MWRKIGEGKEGERCMFSIFYMSRYLNIFAFSMTWCLCSLCSNPVLIKSVIILEILLTLRRHKTQKCDPSRGKVRTTANCGCGDGGSRQEGAVLPGDAHWGTQWNPRTRVLQFWHQYAFAELRSFIFIICKPQPKKYKYSFAKPRPLPLSFNNWYSQCIQRRCLLCLLLVLVESQTADRNGFVANFKWRDQVDLSEYCE